MTDMNDRAWAFDAIDRERMYQDWKWGTIDEHPHTVGEWLLILESELNEAKAAWVKWDADGDALREILQVAAVAVACMEQHEPVERNDIWEYVTVPPEHQYKVTGPDMEAQSDG